MNDRVLSVLQRVAALRAPAVSVGDAMPEIRVGDVLIEGRNPYYVLTPEQAALCNRYSGAVEAIYRDPIWQRPPAPSEEP